MDDPRSGSKLHVPLIHNGLGSNGHHTLGATGTGDITPSDGASGDAAHAPRNDAGQITNSNGSADGSSENLGIALMSDADREYLSEQIIGQTPLLPPREPLGARLAGFMARRHGVLMALCALLLWAAMTLRPPGEGEVYKRGAIAKDNIYAPRAATVLDRDLTNQRKREAAALVPTEYDGNPKALIDTLDTLREISAALRNSLAQNVPAESALTPREAAAKTPAADASSTRNSGARGSLRDNRRAKSAADVRRAENSALQALQASRAAFTARLERPLPGNLTTRVLQIAPARWPVVERTTASAVRLAYEQNGEAQAIRSDHLRDDLAIARLRMRVTLQKTQGLSPAEKAVAADLAQHLVREPNFIANQHRTEHAQQEARNRVPAAYIDIRPDTLLVEAGTRIDENTWAVLEDMDMVAVRFDSTQALARLVLCLVMVAFCAAYVVRFHPQLVEQPAALWLTAMLPVAFVTIFRFLLRAPQGDQMMVPLVETGAMLLTILLNARIGLLAAFVMASLCAIMARVDSGLFLATALASSVGVLGVAEIASYRHLARAALLLATTNAVLAGVLGTLRQAPVSETTTLALWGALTGAAAVGVTYCLAMFLERPFGITTHLRLLELSAPDEIVMRRMQSEAPGTYTHSLMVAQLSEAAAKAVGADPLLCRVGGLYHDIGKLRRPHCFVENQVGENVHDRLSPQMSSLLIVAHVKDGLELGRALRLPQPVLDIIAQHHGTTLIAYFYHRAAQRAAQKAALEQATQEQTLQEQTLQEWRSGNDASTQLIAAYSTSETDEALFRYPGPKPQSKEAAIVLLADTVEASSRALPNLTPERLEEHIKAMTAQRLQDGELSECELTLRDLQTIERTFAHVLRGVLHHRIEYPDLGRALKEDGEARDWTHDTLTDPLADGRFAPAPEPAPVEERTERRPERRSERRPSSLPDRRSGRTPERNLKSEKARSATKTALSSHLRHHGNSSAKETAAKGEHRRTNEKPRPNAINEYSEASESTRPDQSGNEQRGNQRESGSALNPDRARRSTDVVKMPGAHHVDAAGGPNSKLAANGHTAGRQRNGTSANGIRTERVESDAAQRGSHLPDARPLSQPDAAASPE